MAPLSTVHERSSIGPLVDYIQSGQNTKMAPGGLSKITKKNSYKKPKKRGSKKNKGKGGKRGKKGKGTKKGKVHGILNRIRAVRTKYSKKKKQ